MTEINTTTAGENINSAENNEIFSRNDAVILTEQAKFKQVNVKFLNKIYDKIEEACKKYKKEISFYLKDIGYYKVDKNNWSLYSYTNCIEPIVEYLQFIGYECETRLTSFLDAGSISISWICPANRRRLIVLDTIKKNDKIEENNKKIMHAINAEKLVDKLLKDDEDIIIAKIFDKIKAKAQNGFSFAEFRNRHIFTENVKSKIIKYDFKWHIKEYSVKIKWESEFNIPVEKYENIDNTECVLFGAFDAYLMMLNAAYKKEKEIMLVIEKKITKVCKSGGTSSCFWNNIANYQLISNRHTIKKLEVDGYIIKKSKRMMNIEW